MQTGLSPRSEITSNTNISFPKPIRASSEGEVALKTSTRAICILVLFLLPAAGLAAKKDKTGIGPGPMVITPEEAAIVADPDNGIEHAVILAVEVNRDESFRTTNEITFHFRAKILSNEARDLADITLPYNIRRGRLKNWWARAILPDGTVHELAKEDLEEQVTRKGATKATDYAKLKGAIPGVEAGAVIDYGYMFQADGGLGSSVVAIQRGYQVRKFHYRWVPYLRPNYLITHQEERGIELTSDKRSMTIKAENLPAVDREPYGPPFSESQAILYIYYNSTEIYQPKEFWDFVAKNTEELISDYMKGGKEMKEFLARIPLPEEAPLEVKLKALYSWIGKNIENTGLRSSERREAQARIDTDKDFSASVREVLDNKEGEQWQVNLLFMAFARLLGADAEMVNVMDRTEGYWDLRLMKASQFDDFLVAVKAPGEPKDKYVILDPGSGLPYGRIRWWYTMVRGMLCTKEGAEMVTIQSPKADENGSVYEAAIGFEDDGELQTMSWTWSATGQSGYSERLRLRGMKPDEREDRLFELCGTDGDFEVTSATAKDLDSLGEALEVVCEAESFTDGIGDNVGTYSMSLIGPWIDSLPVFVEEKRETPIIFRYAWTSHTSVDIKAPEGFMPRGGYSPISADTSLGKYRLFIAPTADGYHVERKFTMPHTSLAAKHYEGVKKYFDFIKLSDETTIEFVRKAAQ